MEKLYLTQSIYRNLLDVMSKPGTVCTLDDTFTAHWPTGMLAIAATLIDHEVDFCVLEDGQLAQNISDITQGGTTDIQEADFILVPGGDSRGRIREAKTGLPEFPDQGATIIYQAETLSADGDGSIQLQGPGIKETSTPSITGVPMEELSSLSEINCQYPLGVDVIFIDSKNQVMAIPRSVQVLCTRA
jgi:alpha-D-ribose 1-methylphosphonate 5-triphosphate synthase subunit PhnH